ncbi:MAG: HEPN domain-containing protein [Candidatus Aenigmarchaeota archaeon]|nr:HEPN domain-containing protein [Candidatus Aenigmarchaeota archaeon]
MEKQDFFSKLKASKALELVNPSEEICSSYLEKSEACIKSATLLLNNDLYENSISMSYYAMYNSLTALLFKIGIKCENHSGSILLLQKLFNRPDLFKTISFAKDERIDKQYYVSSKKNVGVIKDSAHDMVSKAENFVIQLKLIIKNLGNEDIETLRKRFKLI